MLTAALPGRGRAQFIFRVARLAGSLRAQLFQSYPARGLPTVLRLFSLLHSLRAAHGAQAVVRCLPSALPAPQQSPCLYTISISVTAAHPRTSTLASPSLTSKVMDFPQFPLIPVNLMLPICSTKELSMDQRTNSEKAAVHCHSAPYQQRA